MENTTDLIVLHTTKYGENSLILHALTREYGRRGFMVKGIGRKTSTSLFYPLNILEADIFESRKSALGTARKLVSKYPLAGIRNSVSKNAVTMFVSEVLYRVVKDGTSDRNLYDVCERNILLLDAISEDFANFHLWFLLEFISVLGFSPAAEDLEPFLGEDTGIAARMVSSSFSEAMLIPMTGEKRNAIAGKLLKYIEYHTESAVNVNSLKVLNELFHVCSTN